MGAHLCLLIEIINYEPKIVEANIYSVPPEMLSTEQNYHHVQLFEDNEREYSKARENIINKILMDPTIYGWLCKYLPDEFC